MNIEVDYKKAMPPQWWHLIKSYCDNRKPGTKFTSTIQCGELLVWMAEVAKCVDTSELNKLVDDIIKNKIPRGKANRMIQDLCFNKIVERVESSIPVTAL